LIQVGNWIRNFSF